MATSRAQSAHRRRAVFTRVWQGLYLTNLARAVRRCLLSNPGRPHGHRHNHVCPGQGMEFDSMQKSRLAHKKAKKTTATKKTTAARGNKSSNGKKAAAPRSALVSEGTPEFDARCRDAMEKVCRKYAWTAQQQGFVLRNNPLKQPPLKDYVFGRMAKADYGFRYLDRGGRRKFWYPDPNTVLSLGFEPEYNEDDDTAFVVTERIEFMPGQPEITHDADGCRVLNLWKPPQWTADENAGDPRFFMEHLTYVLNNDEPAVQHVLNFLAHLVQRPQERIGHALLITSEAKGIGKSTLGTVVRRLVGEQNSRVVQTKDLKSSFDGWLMGKLVVHVDEVYEAGNWDLANKLKPLITEPTVSANIKYGPQIEIENYARFIMFSNHGAPLNIEDGDRRYFVFNSKAQPRPDEYYDTLYREIETGSAMNDLYTFLSKRDLSDFNSFRRPPMTEAKRQIIADSEHPLHTYIIEAVTSGHFRSAFQGFEFSFDDLTRQLAKDGYGAQAKNTREIGIALDLAGVQQIRRTIGGKKVRRYVLPNVGPSDPNGPDIAF